MNLKAALLLPILAGCSGTLPPAFSVVRVLARSDAGVWEGSAIPIRCDLRMDGAYRVVFLTARHLLEDRMWVNLFEAPNYQFQRELVPVRLMRPHPTLDLALLTVIVDHPVPTLDLEYRVPEIGETLWSAGYAHGDALLVDNGVVSSLWFSWTFPDWEGGYTGSMVLIGGMSGGAVLSESGGVVAVIVGRSGSSDHLGVFLPVIQARDWIEMMLKSL